MLDQDLADLHYNGFCSESCRKQLNPLPDLFAEDSVLWPLFHYQPDEFLFETATWEAYQKANALFADTIAADIQDGDLVWIHDYHLMLLPVMLRERIAHTKHVRIGFFLHTSFPCTDVLQTLPVHESLIKSLLQCDLVGFHTDDYKRHFLCYCREVLDKCFVTPNGVCYAGRDVEVQAFPIGIDVDKFSRTLMETNVRERVAELKLQFQGLKVLIGVDRLDYIKGIPQKLDAFELFLNQHPEWIGKVVLLQIAVPSRESVKEYQHLSETVNEHVGRINGKFGTANYMPVQLLHHSVGFQELLALYSTADVCLISSSRDGMNLVAYEYVACRLDTGAELVLSEFAGAAETMTGYYKLNPWDVNQFADAIRAAICGSLVEKQQLDSKAKLRSSVAWGEAFVNELEHPPSGHCQAWVRRDWHPRDGFDGASHDENCIG